ncbi:MAG: hypothetical protein JW984_14010 [Deltaproteobacteria bacterium]|uniref:Uncharacterized protein n=1 Tax=Candidatus Zymogenus saltonus TaxID=2844893 RepID=A0A9D8PPG8_9DELT|nr:hypothetical protein [Candidatus Zymogenus saltonus]
MEIVGFALFLFVAGCIAVATAVSAIFVWIGAKLAGISGATFLRSFWAALVSSFLVWALTGIGAAVFGFGSIAGWIIGVIITLFVLKIIFNTTWGKAFLAWLFHGMAQLLVLGILALMVVVLGVAAIGLLLV